MSSTINHVEDSATTQPDVEEEENGSVPVMFLKLHELLKGLTELNILANQKLVDMVDRVNNLTAAVSSLRCEVIELSCRVPRYPPPVVPHEMFNGGFNGGYF